MSNEKWYEQFNTKMDVRSAIVLTPKHQVLLYRVAEESNKTFKDMTLEEKKETREYVEKR